MVVLCRAISTMLITNHVISMEYESTDRRRHQFYYTCADVQILKSSCDSMKRNVNVNVNLLLLQSWCEQYIK